MPAAWSVLLRVRRGIGEQKQSINSPSHCHVTVEKTLELERKMNVAPKKFLKLNFCKTKLPSKFLQNLADAWWRKTNRYIDASHSAATAEIIIRVIFFKCIIYCTHWLKISTHVNRITF